tara:strand:+ start:328 stop:1605 length:1278 start_codon:yes stop_codon:yes gene_type:complete
MAKLFKIKKPYTKDTIISEEGEPYAKELGIHSRNSVFFNELLNGEIESKMNKYGVSYEMAKILHKYDISYEDAKNIEYEVKIEEDRQATNAANDADRYYANQAANKADRYYANQAANKADRRYANQAILNALLAPEAQAIIDLLPESEESALTAEILEFTSKKGFQLSENEAFVLAVNIDWSDPDENGNEPSYEKLVENAKQEVQEVEKLIEDLKNHENIREEDIIKHRFDDFRTMSKVRFIIRTENLGFDDAEYINRIIKNWKNIPKDKLLNMTHKGRVDEMLQNLQRLGTPMSREAVEEIVSNPQYDLKKKQSVIEKGINLRQKEMESLLKGISELSMSRKLLNEKGFGDSEIRALMNELDVDYNTAKKIADNYMYFDNEEEEIKAIVESYHEEQNKKMDKKKQKKDEKTKKRRLRMMSNRKK